MIFSHLLGLQLHVCHAVSSLQAHSLCGPTALCVCATNPDLNNTAILPSDSAYCVSDSNDFHMVMMPRSSFQYSSAELHSLRHAPGTSCVAPCVYQTITELNLLHLRSRRAGSHIHQRKIANRSADASDLHEDRGKVHATQYPLKNQAKFCTINAQSLRNKTAEFVDFVLENRFDIVAVCETWLKPGDDVVVGDITPVGYTLKHFPRKTAKRGGGLALLYKSNLTVRFPELDTTPESFEVFAAELISSTLSLSLIVVYRPPSKSRGSSFSMFTSEFESLLDDLCLNQMPVIITGDFNIHVDSLSDTSANVFRNLLASHNLRQSVTCPTHRKGHTLDLLITRESDPTFFNDLKVIDGLGDHSALTLKLHLERPPNQKVEMKSRNVSAIDMKAFCDGIKSSSLTTTQFESSPLSSQAEQYQTTLSTLLDEHAPLKTLRPHSPWYNDYIRTEKQKRRHLEKKWRDSGLEVDRQIYCSQKQKVKHIIRQSKSNYFNDLFTEHAKDQRRIFQIADSLLHRKSKSPLPQHQSNEQLAGEFSQFFDDKISRIRQRCQIAEDLHLPPPKTPPVLNLSAFEEVSEDEVLRIVSSSPPKSCDLDPIPTPLLKGCTSALIPAMTTIINNSLQSGEVPDILKVAQVYPVLKKANLDPENMNNYRPISNLSFLSKTLERVVMNQLCTYLTDESLHDTFQSAYRPYHSVETAIVRVQNDLLSAMNQGKLSLLVLLDLSAAFDTVDHKILLQCLSTQYGICGIALKWFCSYLTSRSSYVSVDGARSDSSPLKYGVPQGSVLGPQLFCMYTAAVSRIITSHGLHYHRYADDTQIYCTVDPTQAAVDSALQCLESCLTDLRKWLSSNYLKLNDEKTEFLVVGSRQQRAKVKIDHLKVGSATIRPSDQVRNLGVIFDSSLTMEQHITSVSKAACISIRNLGRIRKHVNQQVAELLVHAFVTARLDMCNSILTGLSQHQVLRLQRLQNMAARVVTLVRKRVHISPILRDLHWLPINQRITFKLGVLVFKALNSKSPSYISELLTKHRPARSLRSADQALLTETLSRTAWGDRAFYSSGPKVWNSLPQSIRNAESLSAFTSALKTYLFPAMT